MGKFLLLPLEGRRLGDGVGIWRRGLGG